MSRRDLFKNKDMFRKEQDSDSREYQPPQEKQFVELVNRLVKHYINRRDVGELNLCDLETFESEVKTLEAMIEDATDKFESQPLINSLTVLLRDELDDVFFTKTDYLTIVIQALYNLNYSNEFIIGIRDWSEDGNNYVGYYLKAKQNNPLTLGLYGNFIESGFGAEYCNFILHNKAGLCGLWAKHCNFTLYGAIGSCGFKAEDCRFDLMPYADIKRYQAKPSRGNVRRRMDENGEWEEIG